MKFLCSEKISQHKFKTPEGYLVCVDSVLARTGKQTYKRSELFGCDCKDAENEVEVDRTAEEVFSDKTLASFENKPLTIEHPDEDVSVSNHRDLAVGFARDIKRGKDNGQDVMLGTLVFTDEDAIEAIESGEMVELSCGYDADIVDEDNPCQRNIRGNHIALCQRGRAGNARIVDSKVQDGEYHQIDMTDPWGGTRSLIVRAYSFEEAKKKAEQFKPEWKFRAGWSASKDDVDSAKRRGLYVDSVKDEYRQGQTVKYKGMTAKVIKKLSNDEKKRLSYKLNPDAGDYYEIEIESRFGKDRQVVWANRLSDSIKDDALQKGKTYVAKSGAALKVVDYECAFSDYNGEATVIITYDYVSASGKKSGRAKANSHDFWKMLTDKSLTGDSVKDSFRTEFETFLKSKVDFKGPKISTNYYIYTMKRPYYTTIGEIRTWLQNKNVNFKIDKFPDDVDILISKQNMQDSIKDDKLSNLKVVLRSISSMQRRDLDIEDVMRTLRNAGFKSTVEKIEGWKENQNVPGEQIKNYTLNIEGLNKRVLVTFYADMGKWTTKEINAYVVDSVKDNLELPEDEDSTFIYRDAYGKEIIVTNWDGNDVFLVEYDGTERQMNRRDIEHYLDRKGARFSRVLRDSVKDAVYVVYAEGTKSGHKALYRQLDGTARYMYESEAPLLSEKEAEKFVNQTRGKYKWIKQKIRDEDSKMKDKLVDVPKNVISAFERRLRDLGLTIDGKGKTWSGKEHYQVSAKMSKDEFIDVLERTERWIEMLYNVPMTFSANWMGDKCTAGIDLDKQYVADCSTQDVDTYKEATYDLKEQAKEAMNKRRSDSKEDILQKIRTTQIREGDTFEMRDGQYLVQIQNVGKQTIEFKGNNWRVGHASIKESSWAWGRIWKNGTIVFNESDALNIVRDKMIQFLKTIRDSKGDNK